MQSRRGFLGAILAIAAGGALNVMGGDAAEARPASPSHRPPPGAPPPPQPMRERVPPIRRGYVWAAGHWVWDVRRRTYVWVPGRQIRRRPGLRWRQPRWVRRNGRWELIPGAWVR